MSETAIALSPLGEVEGDLENQFIQFYFDCKNKHPLHHRIYLQWKTPFKRLFHKLSSTWH